MTYSNIYIIFSCYRDHLDLHVLTHSFPTRRSADLPLFNRYGEGQTVGTHVDNAVRIQRGSDFRLRSDLSVTVFLEDPDAYDGGVLVIEDYFGKIGRAHV